MGDFRDRFQQPPEKSRGYDFNEVLLFTNAGPLPARQGVGTLGRIAPKVQFGCLRRDAVPITRMEIVPAIFCSAFGPDAHPAE